MTFLRRDQAKQRAKAAKRGRAETGGGSLDAEIKRLSKTMTANAIASRLGLPEAKVIGALKTAPARWYRGRGVMTPTGEKA